MVKPSKIDNLVTQKKPAFYIKRDTLETLIRMAVKVRESVYCTDAGFVRYAIGMFATERNHDCLNVPKSTNDLLCDT